MTKVGNIFLSAVKPRGDLIRALSDLLIIRSTGRARWSNFINRLYSPSFQLQPVHAATEIVDYELRDDAVGIVQQELMLKLGSLFLIDATVVEQLVSQFPRVVRGSTKRGPAAVLNKL